VSKGYAYVYIIQKMAFKKQAMPCRKGQSCNQITFYILRNAKN